MAAAAMMAIGALGLWLLIILYGTLVFLLLWDWFMVPFGLPQISFAWAIGLSAVMTLLTPTPPPAPEGKMGDHMIAIFTKPAIVLLAGWIAKQFM